MKTSFQPSRISTLALAMACLGGPALAQDAAIVTVTGEATVDGTIVAQATMSARIMDA